MKASHHFKGLYYFFVTARYLSIKQAAESLYVTQAAVSQQIRLLEEALGVSLFHRHHRALELTAEGLRLLPHLKIAFDSIERGLDGVLVDVDPNTITVSVLPSFASRWLIPRLGRFYEACPGVSVNLNMTDDLEAFGPRGSDIAIRFGGGNYEGIESRFLMKDYIYPVCHPGYLKSKKIEKIRDLQKLRLLEDTASNMDWTLWFKKKGWFVGKGLMQPSQQKQRQQKESTKIQERINEDISEFNKSIQKISFDGSHYVIDSALSAQGVAMVRHSLVAESVDSGHLEQLFDSPLEMDYQYFVCAPPHYFQREKVIKFTDWITAEMNQFFSRYPINHE